MVVLDTWQKEVLDYDGDILLCTGRRIGKTYTLARKAIDYMAKHKNTPVIIISLTEDQAQIILSMSLNYAIDNYQKLLGKGKNKPTMKTLHLNGGRMLIRPVGNGEGVRGFEGGILIVDEASRMKPLFWESAKPVLLTAKSGKLWMASTLNGKSGYFWEAYKDAYIDKNKEARFKVWRLTTPEVLTVRKVNKDWTQAQSDNAIRLLEMDKREMSSKAFGQEYLCIPAEELNQLWSDDLLNSVCTIKTKQFPKHNNFTGHDLARYGGDEIVHTCFHKVSDTEIIQIDHVVKKEQSLDITEQQIIEFAEFHNAREVGIDAGSGSIGVNILDYLLKHPRIKRKVVAMNNREISLNNNDEERQRLLKEDMYNLFTSAMEHNHVKLLNDLSIKESLKSVQLSISASGKVEIDGSYTHQAEAIVRAYYLAYHKKLNKLDITYW